MALHGVACHPKNNAWNQLTLQVQRESDNWLLFQSITLNGVTSTINRYYAPGSVSGNWWGITVNYQMDYRSRIAILHRQRRSCTAALRQRFLISSILPEVPHAMGDFGSVLSQFRFVQWLNLPGASYQIDY